uniref:Interleukin-13 n=1 Tax=Phascolarctos cinereus TaxID=38626 RepID=A0A6P5KPS0_PHACI|nr:interleukin-13 [Phascolarctos cinereus]
MEVGIGMALWVKGIILLTCLEGYVSSSPIHKNDTMKEVILQLHSLNTNPKQLSCNSSMVWQVNFRKEKGLNSRYQRASYLLGLFPPQPCAALEVLNNITNCPKIEPLKRNMQFLLGNSSRNETCLEVQDTKIQLSRFLKDLHTFLLKNNRDGIFKPSLGIFTKE